jgi:acetyl esterase/lipase
MRKIRMNSIQMFVLVAALSGGVIFAKDKTDIEYGKAGDVSLRLDAHVPDGPGPFPMVLIVHGGGWGAGDKRKDITLFFEPLAKTNFTWFSINYRLAPTNHWPACLEDVQAAIRWVKARAKEYKGDPQRLALMGYSAGGQLVCLAAVLAKKDTRVQAVVGFSPPTDLEREIDRRGGLGTSLKTLFGHDAVDDQTRPLLKEMSSINYVKPGLPPFLLIQGDADKSVPYDLTVKFQAKLKENNVPCEMVTVKGAPHRIADWDKFDPSYKEKLIAWLNRTLGVSAANPAGAQAVTPDITVAADGSEDFKTIQEAVNSIPRENRERIIVFIKDGLYHEKVRIDPGFVTLRGQNRQGTRIEFPQGTDDFTNHPDAIGRAVLNINGSDFVLENLTVRNAQGVIGPHAFAVSGRGDKTVITDCDVLSEGADTLALWGDRSGSYQARCNIRGSVDFICPRGWCYMTDCTVYQVNPAAHATIWHDGSRDKDMKFVLRNCQFDGTNNWILARHHHDAQFFLLDCTFSKTMRDLAPYRVVYPIAGDKPSERDAKRNRDLDASNVWGERAYYYNCHRDGGDYDWYQDNLSSAPNSPRPDQITAAWTFAGKWDPERRSGPTIQKVIEQDGRIAIVFSESVTTKGKPRLVLKSGGFADYASGSGTDELDFMRPADKHDGVDSLDMNGGAIIATEAATTLRVADVSLPQKRE